MTLLGRGVGESCVVHYGDGNWLIVDSFTQSNASNQPVPAAQTYLERLGVGPRAVKHIAITHLHTDHYRGTEALHTEYEQAKLWVTDALSEKRFKGLLVDETESVLSELSRAVNSASGRTDGSGNELLGYLACGMTLVEDEVDGLRIRSLAPTTTAVNAAARDLAKALKEDHLARKFLRDDNRTSACLHIRAKGVTALLTGDVINHGKFGWHAILGDGRNANLPPVGLVKVPHHGSVEAHHPPMWDGLVERGSPSLVAPYWPSAIPRAEGIKLLTDRGPVWQAHESSSPQTVAGNTFEIAETTGVIQARRTASRDWDVKFAAPAFHIPSTATPVSATAP
ncbi:hypothetical protein ACVW00_000044 [Marmoricola sp. URHA0025 HA25]